MTIKTGMLIGIAVLLSVLSFDGSLFAYCGSPHRVYEATDRMDRATRDLQRVARQEAGRSPLTGSVHRLARSVNELQNTLGNNISCEDLRSYFGDISTRYHEVRRQFTSGYGFSYDPRIANHWSQVENAYYAMRRAVYAGSDENRGGHQERNGIYIPLPDFR